MRIAQWVPPFSVSDSGEALPIEKSNRTKIIIVVVCLIAAVVVWYVSGSSERRRRADLVASVAGLVYHVECTACGFDGEMAADQYVANQGSLGLSLCPKCGAEKVQSLGDAGSDPDQFMQEVESNTTVSEVQQAIEVEERALDKVVTELAVDPLDPERENALRRERARLEAKLQALNVRWSRILAPELDR